MLWTPSSGSSFRVDNWGADPSGSPGTSVVPGASGAEGTFTQVLAALAQEVHGLYVRVSNGATATQAKNHLLDIGVDPAGGASYVAVISNIVCGSTTNQSQGAGKSFYFPLRIPAGATVAVRIQGSHATAGTVIVSVRAYGQPDAGWLLPVGQYSETIGTITNSNGVNFTPGDAADGTWVSLGTTARELWWWQVGYQIDDSTMAGEYTYVDIGVGDATNKRVLCRVMHEGSNAEVNQMALNENLIWQACYARVPAGGEIWIRGRCDAAPNSVYNGVAIAIGG